MSINQFSHISDASGHKHPIHGAPCGHSTLALRAPAYEETISLSKKSAEEHHLKAPIGFAVDYSQNYIRRDFVRDFDIYAVVQGLISPFFKHLMFLVWETPMC